MSAPEAITDTILKPAETVAVPADERGTWFRLYRFHDELEATTDLMTELTATLRLAKPECGADLAFWYSGPKLQSVLTDGVRATPAEREWCQTVARTVLDGFAPDVPLGSVDAAALADISPRPTASAFVRLRPFRLGCVVVASFRPGHVFGPDTLAVLRYLGRALYLHQKHSLVARGLRGSLMGLFRSLLNIVDARDSYLTGHSERVARIARRIGEEMDLPEATLNDLYLAGLLHDVGTLGVPDEVTMCPVKLTGEQMAQMRRHVLIGDELLASSKHVDRLRPGVRNHHERWDGKGYPDALAGEAIPLLARVIAVADACDALMSARRYRPPLSPPQIEAVFRRFADIQWDPGVVAAFLKCSSDIFPPIYQKGVGDSAMYALSEVVSAEVERSTIFHQALDDSSGRGRV